ncbi:50S ribosomal protein L14 [Apiospora phragmitis]|uniref:50S ribosomal protein L14 n=1 Tax=Apiospora phragmitis TaxID=2905665 RepID=A0ABR1UIN4_9PEZI
MLNCIDNSGAAIVECALVVGRKRHASIGKPKPASIAIVLPSFRDRIVAIVQKQRGASDAGMGSASAANKVQRPDGSVVKFDDNACVLISKAGDPIGTRVNGVVGAELRRKKWSKILSMAPAHA